MIITGQEVGRPTEDGAIANYRQSFVPSFFLLKSSRWSNTKKEEAGSQYHLLDRQGRASWWQTEVGGPVLPLP